MPATARNRVFDPRESVVLHTVCRTAQQEWIFGLDDKEDGDCTYRREWLCDIFGSAASVFAIDVGFVSFLSNHIHAMIRNRPDIVATWSDDEIIRRWVQASYLTKSVDGKVGIPTKKQLDKERARCASEPDRMELLRIRLANPSEFMKCVNENIARRVNQERGTVGHVWEGRFYAKRIDTESIIVLVALYIELNQIRAGEANTPEESFFSSAYCRVGQYVAETDSLPSSRNPRRPNNSQSLPSPCPWLGPTSLQDTDNQAKDEKSGGHSQHRASNKGWLPLSLAEYLSLLDWTGREILADKRGAIPNTLAPILLRLGLTRDDFESVISGFSKDFYSLLATPRELRRRQKHSFGEANPQRPLAG